MLAMTYAAAHPEHVDRLVLADSGGMTLDFFQYFSDNITLRLLPGEKAALNYWSEDARADADPELAAYEQFKAMAAGYFFDRKYIPGFEEHLHVGFLTPQVNGLLMADLIHSHYDLRPAFSGFRKPVLIVQGRQDPVGDGTAYETHAVLSHSQIVFIPRCGHLPWVEQPEAFFRTVNDFLGEGQQTTHKRLSNNQDA